MTERLSLLRYPDFRRLTSARFLVTFASQMQGLTTAWLVYQLTHDPLYLGLIGLVEAAPALTLALYAGDVVDRRNPLAIYRGLVRVLLGSGLLLFAAVAAPASLLSPLHRLIAIYLSAFVAGCARGFSQPATYALVPQIVPREELALSSAWLTTAFQMASVLGPALAGLAFAWKGASLPCAMVVVLLVGAVWSAERVQFRPPLAKPTGEPALSRVTSGLRFVFSNDLLLPALALDMFAVLFGGVEAILPIFAADILKIGAAGLGMLQAAPAIGALLGSALMIKRPVNRGAGRILLIVVTGFGICIIGFALSTTPWLSMALLGVAGALDAVSMVIRGAIVQLSSPSHMRGRVSSVNAIFIGTSNELGAFESGIAAKWLGTVPSVVVGGALTLATVVFAALFSPRLRRMDLDSVTPAT